MVNTKSVKNTKTRRKKCVRAVIAEPKKCYRYFIDDAGQGFEVPCCRKVDEWGSLEGGYDTFVVCGGEIKKCPKIKFALLRSGMTQIKYSPKTNDIFSNL